MFHNLVIFNVEGVNLIMPEFLAQNWPNKKLLDFPNFCGAGEGFSEKIVPEGRFGISYKGPCFIHDVTHSLFPSTYFYFCISNAILFFNCFMMIVNAKGKFKKILQPLRIYSAATYLVGVMSDIGWNCFRRGKKERNEKLYKWYEDESILKTLMKVGVYPNSLEKK